MSDTPGYTEMTGPQMLIACGRDADKWTAAFIQSARKIMDGGVSAEELVTDRDWLIGWFANAIEAACNETERAGTHTQEVSLLRERIAELEEALRPFAAIPPVALGDGLEAVHYWSVIGHPTKSHFTREDLERARNALQDRREEPQTVEAVVHATSAAETETAAPDPTSKHLDAIHEQAKCPLYVLADLLEHDGPICAACAEAWGAVWPEGHVATFSVSKCVMCGDSVATCAASDWNWPTHKGRKAPREL